MTANHLGLVVLLMVAGLQYRITHRVRNESREIPSWIFGMNKELMSPRYGLLASISSPTMQKSMLYKLCVWGNFQAEYHQNLLMQNVEVCKYIHRHGMISF